MQQIHSDHFLFFFSFISICTRKIGTEIAGTVTLTSHSGHFQWVRKHSEPRPVSSPCRGICADSPWHTHRYTQRCNPAGYVSLLKMNAPNLSTLGSSATKPKLWHIEPGSLHPDPVVAGFAPFPPPKRHPVNRTFVRAAKCTAASNPRQINTETKYNGW